MRGGGEALSPDHAEHGQVWPPKGPITVTVVPWAATALSAQPRFLFAPRGVFTANRERLVWPGIGSSAQCCCCWPFGWALFQATVTTGRIPVRGQGADADRGATVFGGAARVPAFGAHYLEGFVIMGPSCCGKEEKGCGGAGRAMMREAGRLII